MSTDKPKIAIVHDWLTTMGGAESVIEVLHGLYPEAPIYTLIYNPNKMPESFRKMDIRTSSLQKYPFAKSKHQLYLQFMPSAIENFNLNDYDVVLSSSSSCAKGVITRADTCHICYCNTPMRYAWDFRYEYTKDLPWLLQHYVNRQMRKIRIWDYASAGRVDYFLANSNNVATRIRKHYRRESTVICPPVDTDFFNLGGVSPNDYFLCAGRLVKYKRVDLAIQACEHLRVPLVIAGDGEEYKNLKRLAGKMTAFLGRVSREQLRELYQGCSAFLFPGEEDFGIAPVEAQACGRPVIAFGRGGAREIVLEGTTGLFFKEQSAQSLIDAIEQYQAKKNVYDSMIIRTNAEKFSKERFQEEITSFIQKTFVDFKQPNVMT